MVWMYTCSTMTIGTHFPIIKITLVLECTLLQQLRALSAKVFVGVELCTVEDSLGNCVGVLRICEEDE